jgi:hypothetical protein
MVEFKTPSGYIVKLKRHYLTYGEKLEIQKLYLKSTKVDPITQKIIDLDTSVVFEANKMVFNYLVIEIITPDNQSIKENLYDYVMNLKEEDGQAIFNELNKYLNPIQDLEKKSN